MPDSSWTMAHPKAMHSRYLTQNSARSGAESVLEDKFPWRAATTEEI